MNVLIWATLSFLLPLEKTNLDPWLRVMSEPEMVVLFISFVLGLLTVVRRRKTSGPTDGVDRKVPLYSGSRLDVPIAQHS